MPLLNRAADGKFTLPPDGWFHLVPKGEFYHPEMEVIQVVDDRALAEMVNRFQAQARQPNFPGLLLDYEHFSYDPEKSSSAAGWIEAVANRADGLWGKIRLTAEGEASITGGNYRLISPAWLPRDVEQIDNKRVRPLRLDTAGLTNNPNMRGMVPLSNRATPADAAATPPTQPPKTTSMNEIAKALGLSPEASAESCMAEIKKLQTTGADHAAMTNRAKTLESENTKLKAENTKLIEAQVEADLTKYANRFAPEKRDAWKQSLLANREVAIQLLESIAAPADKPAPGSGGQVDKPMHNRQATKTPAGQVADDPAKAEKEKTRASKISNRATELMAANKHLSRSSAWKMAEAEIPAQ